jgi:hypothetical protein
MQTQQNETDGKLGGDVRSEHSAAIHQPVSDGQAAVSGGAAARTGGYPTAAWLSGACAPTVTGRLLRGIEH